MKKINFKLSVNHQSDIQKYQQMVNSVNNAIAENILHKGDMLPSVNSICKTNQLSRDTVFKEMGTKAAEFFTEDSPKQCYIPTKLTIRESFKLCTT